MANINDINREAILKGLGYLGRKTINNLLIYIIQQVTETQQTSDITNRSESDNLFVTSKQLLHRIIFQ